MIRGVQKNMIWVQTPKSQYFEEVHFVIRRGLSREDQRNGEMTREANRILAEHDGALQAGKKNRRAPGDLRAMIPFLWGMLSGSLMVAALWIVTVVLGRGA